jgi:peptidoglycan-binding protein ArfA
MSDPDQTRTITGWRSASRFYRRNPGPGWLLALFAIPLLLALLGWGVLDNSPRESDLTSPHVSASETVPAMSAPNVSLPTVAPALSILRNGNDITLSGDLPDLAAKTALLDTLKGVFGPDVNLIDKLNITAGVSAPDLSGLGAVFKAALDIPDFNWKFDGDTVTLIGAAPSDAVKADVEAAAKTAWPNARIDNQIQVVAAPAAGPAPAPVGECGSLQAEITGLLNAPINFESDGSTLTPESTQMLTGVADKLKACPESQIAVSGYTDSSGNDSINIPLSANRAKAVADFLVLQGVAGDHVTSNGFGSADPIASNDTPEGKALNRRVEITVS